MPGVCSASPLKIAFKVGPNGMPPATTVATAELLAGLSQPA
eukprot:SAG11_NODE_18240_length_496_cov_1.410579_1_plen_40_part_10